MKIFPILLLPLISACTFSNQAILQNPDQTTNQPTPSIDQVSPTPTRSSDPDQQILDDLNQTDDQEIDNSFLELESELK